MLAELELFEVRTPTRARLSYQRSDKYNIPETDICLPNISLEAGTFYSRLTRNSNLGFSNSGAILEIFWSKRGAGKAYDSFKFLNLYNWSLRTFPQGIVIHTHT